MGVLGQGEGVAESAVPRAVAGLGGLRILTVAAGRYHTLACSDEGVVYSFGIEGSGHLGHGTTGDQHIPLVIEALQGVRVSAVAAGEGHSLALSVAGALYSFGEGYHGQLGHGDAARQHAPRLVAALQGVRVSAVAAGENHSLALSEAGEVFSFGSGSNGQLGHGDWVNQHTPRPIAALQGVRVGAVAAGGWRSLVASLEGRLYSLGRGLSGALGHGDEVDQHIPRLVTALHGVRITAMAAGAFHSLALSEGKVYSFGCGQKNVELGDGGIANQLTPLSIVGLQGVRVHSVAAGRDTSLAVTTDGEAYGWGCGVRFGQPYPALGLELTEHQRVPLKFPGLRVYHA